MKVKVLVAQSCPALCNPTDYLTRFLCPWDFSGKNPGVGCHFLLQGMFPNQGLNLGPLHCRQIPYHLSHQGSQLLLRERENWGVWDGHEHTAVFKMHNHQGLTV